MAKSTGTPRAPRAPRIVRTDAPAPEQAAPAPEQAAPAPEQAAPAPEQAAPAPAPVNALRFSLAKVRPAENPGLFAHTAAFLQVTGLLEGGTVPYGTFSAIMGGTARAWHGKKGRIVEIPATFDKVSGAKLTPACEKLTADGIAHFMKENRPKPEHSILVSAYANAMRTGQPDGDILKSNFGIVQIAK